MNKFIFVGRLTKDPERRGQGENIAAVFTLAINRPYFNDNIREADFIQIKAFRKLAENCLNWLQKGSMVAVEGAVRTGRYEKDGQQIYTTDFVADRVEFLAKTKEAPSNAQQPSANSQPFSTQQNPYYPVNGGYSRGGYSQPQNDPGYPPFANDDPFYGAGEQIDISDDDLPF